MFNSSESTARSTIEASCLETFPLRSTVLRLFDPSAVADIQTDQACGVSWSLDGRLPSGAFGSMGGMLTRVCDLSLYVAAFLDSWPLRASGEGTDPPVLLRGMQQVGASGAHVYAKH